MVRAKFVVKSYETSLQNTPNGREECRTVALSAVYGDSPENKEFFKWTPNGTITMGLLTENAWSQFKLGAECYVDFTPVDPVGAAK